MNKSGMMFRSAIVLYFMIAFEVAIMISPFAGFFYSVFNPVLLKLAAYPSTRWLSAFYLPHMVLLQDGFLQFVRVMGSILFVLGMITFFVCAFQIYTAKFRGKGAVLGGLYSVIRHPQYAVLGIAGLGLSILWPRMLTVLLWLIMALVYFFLAKDEERRMLNADRETYSPYMNKTGMFLPKRIERAVTPPSHFSKAVSAVIFAAAVIGTAFLLRAYTIDHLTLWTGARNAAALAILPEDGFKMGHRMGDILALREVRERMADNKHYLVYFLPQDYIMQGMIGDTGGDWKLYKQHHTIRMIADWVFNPFGHLREGHHAMHMGRPQGIGEGGVVRRLIFLSVEEVKVNTPSDLFAINALRVPQFMIDVDVHNMKLMEVKDLPHGSGWGSVPTPSF